MDSDKLVYGYYQTAAEKLDYFLIGIVVFVCGYLTKEIDFKPIGLNVETIQVISLLFFGVAGFISLKRSEKQIHIYKLNYIILSGEKRGLGNELNNIRAEVEKKLNSSNVYYKVRGAFFIMGFVTYISSKIIEPYMCSILNSISKL